MEGVFISSRLDEFTLDEARLGFDGISTTGYTKKDVLIFPNVVENYTASGNIGFGNSVMKGNTDDTIVMFDRSKHFVGVALEDIALYSFFYKADDNVNVIRRGQCRVMIPWDMNILRGTHMKPAGDGFFYPSDDGQRTTQTVCETLETVTAGDYKYRLQKVTLY